MLVVVRGTVRFLDGLKLAISKIVEYFTGTDGVILCIATFMYTCRHVFVAICKDDVMLSIAVYRDDVIACHLPL